MISLSKIFGTRKGKVESLLEKTLQGLIEKSGLDLSFDVKVSGDKKEVLLDVFGADEELLKDKDGALLDGLQLYLKRVLQHKAPEDRVGIIVDCDSFRAESQQSLLDLADKLKGIALKKKKAVYFRALPPKERKIVHQHLSGDDRIKSKSVGDGLYKKIKVFPANGGGRNKKDNDTEQSTQDSHA